ncbi:unnamed protein product [Adineta ricciae]|uniref:Uncharacterized protein n=1 Tax=Adineta ricciae TaxID=249248 RepID=A0A815QEH9_ADIRI|nr:unnamed protein product [Adineta ricciae]CAF1461357.1 unnamed protein product [Adineta ricciae]
MRRQIIAVYFLIYSVSLSNSEICSTATWSKDAITVAGGHGYGNKLEQLDEPSGLYLDENDTIYVADRDNNRIMMWQQNTTIGQWVAGLKNNGNDTQQVRLYMPEDIVVDKNGTIYITDAGNYRVVRWNSGEDDGEVLVDHIQAVGVAQDNQGFIYISEYANGQVTKWNFNNEEFDGEIVAKNLGHTNLIFIDQDRSIYSVGLLANRILKTVEGNDEPIVIVGQYSPLDNRLDQLNRPSGVHVDKQGSIYVADKENHRIMRWLKDATNGTLIAGGNGGGSASDQLHYPSDVFLDREGNLYVTDTWNDRVQKFLIDRSSCQTN